MNNAYIRKNKNGEKSNLAVSVLKGLLCALIFAAVTMLVLCAAAMRFDDPDKVSPIFGVAAMLLTALFGGLMTAKFHGQRGLSSGALFGLGMVLILALISLVCGAKITTAVFSILAPVAVLTAALGGVIGAGEKKPKKKRKRKNF